MPKMKTHKGARKRFKVTGTGKVKRVQGVQEPHPHQEDVEAEAPPAPRAASSPRAAR